MPNYHPSLSSSNTTICIYTFIYMRHKPYEQSLKTDAKQEDTDTIFVC